MIYISQICGEIQDFTYIAEIFLTSFGRIATIYGNRISNE